MNELSEWLLEQLGMVVIMGVAIWWLQRRLVKSEAEKEKLAQEVVKLTTLWESKASTLSELDKEYKEKVISILNEIKGMKS